MDVAERPVVHAGGGELRGGRRRVVLEVGSAADVGVQLRLTLVGQLSGAVIDCIAAGMSAAPAVSPSASSARPTSRSTG